MMCIMILKIHTERPCNLQYLLWRKCKFSSVLPSFLAFSTLVFFKMYQGLVYLKQMWQVFWSNMFSFSLQAELSTELPEPNVPNFVWSKLLHFVFEIDLTKLNNNSSPRPWIGKTLFFNTTLWPNSLSFTVLSNTWVHDSSFLVKLTRCLHS